MIADADKDLSEEQVQRILSRVKPAMKKWLNASDLLPFLKRHHVLTNSELSLLNSSTLAQREQVYRHQAANVLTESYPLISGIYMCIIIISIINHTLQSTIRAVISTLTCTSMVSNSTNDSKCYLAVRVHVRALLLP